METAEYWLMACEYGIWNAAITSLQFWAEDLNPITLGIASECVYTTFFWTPTSHTLWQLPEDVLFGCFVIALNAAFTQQFSLADEGYESGSNTDLPTPLQKTPCIHHVSSMERASFDPAHTTPCCPATTWHYDTQLTSPKPVHCCLTFISGSSESDQDPDSSSDSSFRILRWRRRFPNSTYRWWTLDNRDGTRKDILHTWKWVTQQCM